MFDLLAPISGRRMMNTSEGSGINCRQVRQLEAKSFVLEKFLSGNHFSRVELRVQAQGV